MSETKFCHYTTTENAGKILSSGTMYCSNLSSMNDLYEASFHEEEQNRVYVLSFTHSEAKNIPMFYLYSGIDGKGCRIEFTSTKIRQILEEGMVRAVNSHGNMLKKVFSKDEYEIIGGWVFYRFWDDNSGKGYYKGRFSREEDALKEQKKKEYFLKPSWWKYENEYRVVIRFEREIPYNRIAIEFPIREKETGISLTLGYEVTEEEKAGYEEEFKGYGIQTIKSVESQRIAMGLVDRNRHLYL